MEIYNMLPEVLKTYIIDDYLLPTEKFDNVMTELITKHKSYEHSYEPIEDGTEYFHNIYLFRRLYCEDYIIRHWIKLNFRVRETKSKIIYRDDYDEDWFGDWDIHDRAMYYENGLLF